MAKLKNNLSRYLSYVRRGGQVIVYRRDTPIAVLGPVHGNAVAGQEEDGARLRALQRQGIVRVGSGVIPEPLRNPPTGAPAGVLEALLEERAEGR